MFRSARPQPAKPLPEKAADDAPRRHEDASPPAATVARLASRMRAAVALLGLVAVAAQRSKPYSSNPWRRRSNATTYVSQLGSLYSLEQRHDEERIRQLLVSHRCEAVYLDVGSNIGVQIRKLFEPHKYPGAPVHALFKETFASTDRCRVCAIGVEPNPRHRNRLSQLQSRLAAAGAGVTVFEAAAGSADGVLTLQFGARKSNFEDAGASTLGIGRYRGHDEVVVRMLRLSRLVKLVRAQLDITARRAGTPPGQRAGKILMKLDIEGSEWTVLTDLMDSGALCAVDGVFVEYHDADFERIGAQAGSLRRAALVTMRDAVRSLRAAISPALRGEGSCPARVVDLDDETFVRDPAPWPGGSVCSK